MHKSSVYIVVSAFNESKVIGSVLKELLDSGFVNIVVVNDGSTDNTSEVVKKYPVVLIEHLINRGQGAALATGFKYCSSKEDCRFVSSFDADGQHRIVDLINMLEIINSKSLDIILGSRFLDLKSENLPFSRKIMLKAATFFLRFIYGLNITDAHNGLRIFKNKYSLILMPSTDGMLHASEMLYLIKKHKLNYCEAPVEINYTDYSLSKGQKTSGFIYLGILTIYHKITLLLFEKD